MSFRYGLLIAPASNRVYSLAAAALTMAELAVFNETMLAGALTEIDVTRLGSVDYVTFTAPELTPRAVAVLSNLSSLFALFMMDGSKLLPIELARADRFDSDLLTIQKYPGKTNEVFTKLWHAMLRPGGALGLAFNTFVARREQLLELAQKSGFDVRTSAPFSAFEHRVDQAILRDLIVATKPG